MIVKLASFIGLEKIFTYMGRRKNQLYRQEEMDKKLEKLEYQCPKVILEFYKLQREINRHNSYIAYSHNIIFNFGLLDSMLEQVDLIDTTIINILDSKNNKRVICRDISKFIREERKKLEIE